MKLFLESADKKLFKNYLQHAKDGNMDNQDVVVKIFNPYGAGTWYIINSDPDDPNYLWAIVVLNEVEIGGVLRSDLENIRFGKYNLPLERDLYFDPINAEKLYKKLLIDRSDDYGDLEPQIKAEPKAIILTGTKIQNALKGDDFWLKEDSEDYKIINEATEKGFVRRQSHTQAEWTDKGVKEFDVKGIPEQILKKQDTDANRVYELVLKTIKKLQKEAIKEQFYYPQSLDPKTLAIMKTGIKKAVANNIPKAWIILFSTGTFVKIAHPTNAETAYGNPMLAYDPNYILEKYKHFIREYKEGFYEGGFKYLEISTDDLKKLGFNTMITKSFSGTRVDGADYTSTFDMWISDDGQHVISFQKGRTGEGGYSSFYSSNFRKGYDIQKQILNKATYVKEVDWFENGYGSVDIDEASEVLAEYNKSKKETKKPKMTVVKDDDLMYDDGTHYNESVNRLLKLLDERIKNRKYEYTPKPEAISEIKKGIQKCLNNEIRLDYIHAFVLGTLITTEGEKEGMYSPQIYTIQVQYIAEHFETFIKNTKANWFQTGWKYLDFDISKMQELGFRIYNSNKEIKYYNEFLKQDVVSRYQVWISQDFRHVFTVENTQNYSGLVSIDTEKGFEIAQAITNNASYVKDVNYWVNGLGGMSLDNSIDELSLALEKRMKEIQSQIKQTKSKLEAGGTIMRLNDSFNSEKDIDQYIDYINSLAKGAMLKEKPVVLLEQATIVERPENFYEKGSYITKKRNKYHYIPKFKVGDIVVNKKTNTIGIVRIADDKFGEVKTDADGNVNIDFIEKYDSTKHKGFKIAPSTKKEISNYAKGSYITKKRTNKQYGTQVIRYADGDYRVLTYRKDTDFPHTFKDVFKKYAPAEKFAKEVAKRSSTKFLGLDEIPYKFVKAGGLKKRGGDLLDLSKSKLEAGGKIRFTKMDYKKLIEDYPNYPFYATKSGILQEIFDEATNEKVGAWNSKTNILKFNSKKLKDWLKDNSYLRLEAGGDLLDLSIPNADLFMSGGEIIYNDPDSIDLIVRHFITAGLWATTDDEDNALDQSFSYEDVNVSSLNEIRDNVVKFLKENSEILKKHEITKDDIGHDLFLTSQGHGVGFWDRDYGDDGDILTASTEKIFKSDTPYVGDDGQVYFIKGGSIKTSASSKFKKFAKTGTSNKNRQSKKDHKIWDVLFRKTDSSSWEFVTKKTLTAVQANRIVKKYKKANPKVFIVEKQIALPFEKGGRIDFVDLKDIKRTGTKIWEGYSNKLGQSIGAFAIMQNKKLIGDFYIFNIDEFDKKYYKDIKLKSDEKLFRYETETTKAGGITPIIKINLKSGLIYFLKDLYADDDKNLVFETRSVKPIWISLSSATLQQGGELQNLPNAGLNLFAEGGEISETAFKTLLPFIRIARKSKDGDDFYERARKIQVSPEVGIKWREKYDPNLELGIIEISNLFVKDVRDGKYDTSPDPTPKPENRDVSKLTKSQFVTVSKGSGGQLYFVKFLNTYKRKSESLKQASKRLRPFWKTYYAKFKNK